MEYIRLALRFLFAFMPRYGLHFTDTLRTIHSGTIHSSLLIKNNTDKFITNIPPRPIPNGTLNPDE